MSATKERDNAMMLAKTNFPKALSLASRVSDPWFACQALAGVARFAPDEHVEHVAKKSISVAKKSTDSYRRVAPLAWPLRALIERNLAHVALRILPEILSLCPPIENPVSRSDALFLLWEAVFPFRGHKSILDALVESCTGHWKADYLLRQIAIILASQNREEADRLVASMPLGKYKRQAQKRLAEGQQEQPRQFF